MSELEETNIELGKNGRYIITAILAFAIGFGICYMFYGSPISDDQILKNVEWVIYNDTNHYIDVTRNMTVDNAMRFYENYHFGPSQAMLNSEMHMVCKTVMTK